jgi:hypothetical protein
MTPEVALNTSRETPPPVAPPPPRKKRGLPPEYVAIERNLQLAYVRYKDEELGHYWVYFPKKATNLTARIYPHLDRQRIRVTVFEQDPSDRKDPTKGKRIKPWTVHIDTTRHDWTEALAKFAGRAQTQAEKQPWCFCESFLLLRERGKDKHQFFGCGRYPNCTQTASIGKFEITMDKPYCYTRAPRDGNSSEDNLNGDHSTTKTQTSG